MTFVANDDVISAADEDLWLIPRSNKTDAVELLELVNTNVPQESVFVFLLISHTRTTHTTTTTNNNNIHTSILEAEQQQTCCSVLNHSRFAKFK